MPQQAWNDKRERQYEHVKDSQKQRGAEEQRAEEIAARTVNKDRAQTGEAARASRSSTRDVSSEHRGGKRSGKNQGPNTPPRTSSTGGVGETDDAR
jgi:plasmid stabilization system protein ParE